MPLPESKPLSAMETERLFIALPLPEPVRAVVATLIEPDTHGLTWTAVEQLHLTMRFLGDVPVDRVPGLINQLATIRVAPFLLPIEGVGAFPPRPPARVLWAGVAHADPRLLQLRQRIDDAILRTALPVELRAFIPHVTLARCGEHAGAAAARWLRVHGAFAAPPFRVEHFDLVASTLQPTGAVHMLRHRFSLAR